MDYPHKGPVIQSFALFFMVSMNKLLNKQLKLARFLLSTTQCIISQVMWCAYCPPNVVLVEWHVRASLTYSTSACSWPTLGVIQGCDLGPITLTTFHSHSNSREIPFSCYSTLAHQVATTFCTCHDSIALVACAKNCSSQFINFSMKPNPNSEIFIDVEFRMNRE